MKKVLLISVVVILVVLGIAAFWLASNAQKLANQYKPDIEKALSTTLQTKVTLGEISVQVFPDLQLTVNQVTLKNRSEQQGLQLNNLQLNIQLSALLTGQLAIDKLVLQEPEIRLVKTKEFTYIDGLKPTKRQKSAKTSDNAVTKVKEPASAEPQKSSDSSFNFALKQLELKAGTLTFDDRVNKKEVVFNNVDLSTAVTFAANAVTLKSIDFSASLNDQTPLKMSIEQLNYNMSTGFIQIPEQKLMLLDNKPTVSLDFLTGTQTGKANIKIQDFALEKLGEILNALQAGKSDLTVAGSFSTDSKLNFDTPGQLSINGQTQLEKVQITLPDFTISELASRIKHESNQAQTTAADNATKFKLNDAEFTLDWNLKQQDTRLSLNPVTLKGLSGQVELSTDLQLNDNQPFTARVTVKNIGISEAMKTFAPRLPVKVQGTINNLSASVNGSFKPDLKDSLKGNGQISIAPAVLKDINLAGAALKSVSGLPFLNDALLNKVPEHLRAEFTQPDSRIDNASLDWTISNSVINISKLLLSSKLYQISGSGSITLRQQVNFKADLTLNPELSEAMIKSTKELRYLTDSKGQISFPIQITGISPDLVVTPQLDKLLQSAAAETVKDKLAEGLGRALGGSKESGKETGKALRGLLGF